MRLIDQSITEDLVAQHHLTDDKDKKIVKALKMLLERATYETN